MMFMLHPSRINLLPARPAHARQEAQGSRRGSCVPRRQLAPCGQVRATRFVLGRLELLRACARLVRVGPELTRVRDPPVAPLLAGPRMRVNFRDGLVPRLHQPLLVLRQIVAQSHKALNPCRNRRLYAFLCWRDRWHAPSRLWGILKRPSHAQLDELGVSAPVTATTTDEGTIGELGGAPPVPDAAAWEMLGELASTRLVWPVLLRLGFGHG